MTIAIPTTWIYMFTACMVAILSIQLADQMQIPKWVQWLIAALCIVIAWAAT